MAEGTRAAKRQLLVALEHGISSDEMTDLVLKYCQQFVRDYGSISCPLDPQFRLTPKSCQERNEELLRQVAVAGQPHILKLVLQSLSTLSMNLTTDGVATVADGASGIIESTVAVVGCLSLMAKCPANVAVLSSHLTVDAVTSIGTAAIRMLCEVPHEGKKRPVNVFNVMLSVYNICFDF
ncbi:uncharacterized protein LOC134184155 [Corticium candelabrum]|uniref:uncharacterized protein LOC134184155 n=1 Tax=Corticium candelabrum TaxID=121492 RepID=UPI002E30E91D|nr:uncharacterized protein LOC134184155 [Corticium candelabrum]